MLNRERVVASLALLILIFGIYQILDWTAPLSPINMNMPEGAQPLPQIEPRLYYEDLGASKSPFQPSSDWMPYTPEDLPAPQPEPSRWLVVPLSKSADPTEVGYLFLREPPVEAKNSSSDAPPVSAPSPSGPPEGAVAPSSSREQTSAGGAGFRSVSSPPVPPEGAVVPASSKGQASAGSGGRSQDRRGR